MNISTCQVYKINKINQSLKLLREKEMLTTEYPTKPNIERKKERETEQDNQVLHTCQTTEIFKL